MVVSLVKSLTIASEPKAYRDRYMERVGQFIDAKKRDREIVLPETAEKTSSRTRRRKAS